MSDWISVEDRLPDDACYVLVACEGGNVCSTFYCPDSKFFDYSCESSGIRTPRKTHGKYSKYFRVAREFGYKITHWMPLPEPPKN